MIEYVENALAAFGLLPSPSGTWDCLKQKCGQPGPCLASTAADTQGAVLAPVVMLTFTDGESVLTVGNESLKSSGNTACIKSFEMGIQDGVSAEMEVFDEQGGEFHKFESKTLRGICPNTKGKIKFGWIITKCDGTSDSILCNTFYVILKEVNVTFADGKVSYKLQFKDVVAATVPNSREDAAIGKEDEKISLEEASKKMFTDDCPKIEIKNDRVQGGDPWKWDTGGGGEVKSCWHASGQNKLAAFKRWADSFCTSGKMKGFFPMVDWTKESAMTFWEDPQPNCLGENDARKHKGTLVVGGGKYSNVISFSPTIKYVAAMQAQQTGGASGGPVTGEDIKKKGEGDDQSIDKKCEKNPLQGMSWTNPVNPPAAEAMGTKNYPQWSSKNSEANLKADGNKNSNVMPIEAEVKIIGDPITFMSPINQVGTFVSIVVINPIHLRLKEKCDSWLAQPAINEVMTNDKWLVKGVSHSIKEGSYVTTLKVFLGEVTPKYGNSQCGYAPLSKAANK
jgi:hypothetical protein